MPSTEGDRPARARQGAAPRPDEEAAATADAARESVAARALTDRPRLSIRVRIGGAMAVCFLLTAGVTVAWIVSVREVGASQQLLERVDRYVFEIEQARRFEKNFLLYGTNLEDALGNVSAARQLLLGARTELSRERGRPSFEELETGLLAYERLLERLPAAGGAPSDAGPARERDVSAASSRAAIERELRGAGGRALEDATALASSERVSMHAMVHASKVAAVAGLVVVFLLLASIAGHLARWHAWTNTGSTIPAGCPVCEQCISNVMSPLASSLPEFGSATGPVEPSLDCPVPTGSRQATRLDPLFAPLFAYSLHYSPTVRRFAERPRGTPKAHRPASPSPRERLSRPSQWTRLQPIRTAAEVTLEFAVFTREAFTYQRIEGEARRMRRLGMSLRAIGRELGVDEKTVRNTLGRERPCRA